MSYIISMFTINIKYRIVNSDLWNGSHNLMANLKYHLLIEHTQRLYSSGRDIWWQNLFEIFNGFDVECCL